MANKKASLAASYTSLGATFKGKYTRVKDFDAAIAKLNFFSRKGVTADTTTDWADLEVGDLFIHLPAAAGNSRAGAVATAGTAPFAGVANDFYIVIKDYAG
tara:strand:+ start:406 stop:708 length:303 start_codon:yes stop_codon:yes gene_type:complete